MLRLGDSGLGNRQTEKPQPRGTDGDQQGCNRFLAVAKFLDPFSKKIASGQFLVVHILILPPFCHRGHPGGEWRFLDNPGRLV